MPISPAQIARIRQLDEGRTPGTWLYEVAESDFEIMADGKHNRHVAITTAGCNAAFIAASANAIIPALDEIERLREALCATEEAIMLNKIGHALRILAAALAPSPAEEGV